MFNRRRDRALELSAVALVPLAGGTALGLGAWWVGPGRAGVVVAGGLAALVAAGLALVRGRHRRDDDPAEVVARRRLQRGRMLLAALGSLGLMVGVVLYRAPRPLTALSDETLVAVFAQDAALLDEHRRGMEMILTRLESADVPPASGPVSAQQERMLLESWRAFRSYAIAVEQIRQFHEDYYRFDVGERRDAHVLGFLVTFLADAILYEKTARFVTRVTRNADAKKYLDGEHGGLGGDSFGRFREEVLDSVHVLRLAAGRRYLDVVKQLTLTTMPLQALRDRLETQLATHLGGVEGLDQVSLVTQTYRAELQLLKRSFTRGWYPIQRRAAEILGDTRVRRVGRYLIDERLREAVIERLAPGDILLSRKNWYLSNAGLPGFWPHALIYLGTPSELAAAFDDPTVTTWLAAEGRPEASFAEALAARYPEAWRAYQEHHDGEPNRVLEAVSEGVVTSTLGHAAGDYFAALRPELDRVTVAQALWRAFSYFGRPYDFDFDFATDDAVVCTELVWRAYRPPSDGAPGLDFPLEHLAGRSTLPANGIARHFAEAHPSGLAFVAFIDASEREGQAFFSTEEAFAASCNRNQYDVFLP
ncbi:MAG: YiiX/YebB-like N1pC/P60 family cysteine hydrolase [Polyangiaceae bacterium]